MAFFDSRESVFQIDDTSNQLRNISAFLDEMSGLPGPRNLNDVTAMGDTGRKSIPGLEDVLITLAGHFDDTATTGPDAILGPLRTHTAELDFDYGPEGTTSGDVKYSGKFFLTSYEIESRVGSQVRFRATIQVNGAVTRGTY